MLTVQYFFLISVSIQDPEVVHIPEIVQHMLLLLVLQEQRYIIILVICSIVHNK